MATILPPTLATRAAGMILSITRKWPPAVGGMETYSVKLSHALSKLAKIEVVALPGRHDGSPPSAASLLAFGFRTALKLFMTGSPHGTVHVADMASWPLALAAQIRSRKWSVALSAHGTDVSYSLRGGLKGSLYGAYLRLGARCLKHAVVIANSAATAECTKRYGFGHLVVSPLATDMRLAGPVGPPANFVLFVGRLVERKGCGWFIHNVLPRLPEHMTLKVVGTVWSESERAALDHPRVEFMGPRNPEEVAGLYSKAICVVTPNIDLPNGEFEGFGLVATEASVCGGISLASNHSGLREAVVDGCTGFLLPPGEAETWAAKILEISNWSSESRKAFVHRSMKEAESRYSWDRVAETTFEAYKLTREAS